MLTMALGFGGTLFAAEREIENEEDSVAIKFSECPAAVQKTLTREARGAKIDKVDLESKDGRVVFEADVVIDGKNYEILVAPNGALIAKKLDEDEEENEVEMKLADCPAAVQKTLMREADGATIDEVDKITTEGRNLYKVNVKIDGRNFDVVVTEEGLLLSKELDEDEDDEDEDDEDEDEDEDEGQKKEEKKQQDDDDK
jgi:hypothetical protein